MLKKTVALMLALCCTSLAMGQGSGSDPVGKDESVVKVLRTSNKAQTNKYVCEALEFKNVNPYDIINFFRSVTSREEGDVYSFQPTDGPGGFLVVVCPEYQLPALRQLAKELDQPALNSYPGGVWTYYRMKHRDAMDAGFRDAASYFAGSSAIIAPDRDTNSLFFYDAQIGTESMLDALETTLDKPQAQMELGVKIYEIAANNDGQLGLDYEAWKNGNLVAF